MQLIEIISIVSNRLNYLNSQRTIAVRIGDLDRVSALDSEISDTQATLDKLHTLE